MTTDDRVMTMLERANPVPPDDVPDVAIGAARYLDDLQQRSSTVTIRSTESPTTRRRWAMLGAAAAVIALVVVAAFVVGGEDDSIVTDTPVSTTSITATTSTVPSSPELGGETAALAVVEGFFATYNSGGTDQTLGLLTRDAVVTELFRAGPPNADATPDDREEWERIVAWRTGAGWMLDDATCATAPAQPDEGFTLSCEYSTVTALMQAVDAEPSPTQALVTVVDGLIAEFHVAYGEPLFDSVSGPFTEWMRQYHPEVEGADCCAGDTRAESEQRGQVRRHWAERWSTFLDTYGCTPQGACTFTPEQWLAEYESRCQALDPPGMPTRDFFDHMNGAPRTRSSNANRTQLLADDEALLASDLTDERIAELQQRRLDAMIELGIDERCHPTVE